MCCYPTEVTRTHVLLTYHYLDAGDLDALGSLYATTLVRLIPGHDPIIGWSDLERHYRLDRTRGGWSHRIEDVAAARTRASVRGRIAGRRRDDADVGFVDLFRTGADGLITEQRTYYVPLCGDGRVIR
jgi:SnoaL-like protein